MVNQLQLIVALQTLKAGGTAQALGNTALVKRVLIQNLSTEAITVGTKENLVAGSGIVLNPASAAGLGGGSVELDAPEDVSDAFIDVSQIFWIGATTGDTCSVTTMAWTPYLPTSGNPGNVVNAFYPR